MRRQLAAAAVCAAVLTVSSCVVASPDADTYRDAAASTLGTAASEVSTVQKLLELLDHDKIARPTVVAQLRYSEEGIGGAGQAFGSLNPPPEQDTLAAQAGTLLDDAETQIQDARIAVRRDEASSYAAIASDLETLAAQLEKLETSAS